MGVSNQALQNLLALQQQMSQIRQPGRGGPDESGIITGPILQRRREAREAEAAQQQAELAGQFAEQRGALEFAAQGLPPEFAASEQGQALQQLFSVDPDAAARLSQNIRQQQATAMQRSVEVGRQQQQQQLQFAQAVNSEEARLRTDWQNAIAPTVDVLQSAELAQGQMMLGTPEAAFNSARLFIQQLDKSMVTNPELEAVVNQSGAAGQLANLVNWIEGGGRFDEATRRRMVDSMNQIAAVMQQHGDFLADQMAGLVERNALPINVENVITMGGFANRNTDLSLSGEGVSAPSLPRPSGEEQGFDMEGFTPIE